ASVSDPGEFMDVPLRCLCSQGSPTNAVFLVPAWSVYWGSARGPLAGLLYTKTYGMALSDHLQMLQWTEWFRGIRPARGEPWKFGLGVGRRTVTVISRGT